MERQLGKCERIESIGSISRVSVDLCVIAFFFLEIKNALIYFYINLFISISDLITYISVFISRGSQLT